MGFKSQIADALVARINLVTVANGYTMDVKYVKFDKIKLNIQDYQNHELPAVQLIDLSKNFEHSMSQSESKWFIAIEMVMRTTEQLGTVDQKSLWDFEEDVMRSIMKVPRLGLSFVRHVKLVDAQTDLHLHEPNYVATLGIEILYREPVTRDGC